MEAIDVDEAFQLSEWFRPHKAPKVQDNEKMYSQESLAILKKSANLMKETEAQKRPALNKKHQIIDRTTAIDGNKPSKPSVYPRADLDLSKGERQNDAKR